jgi:NAD(P)-dependent dehydrogenase (short-subunit alcohol dehydrogenase family)
MATVSPGNPLFDLSGKIVLITGASRGLGHDMALAFAEAGASLILTSRRQDRLQNAEHRVRTIGAECLTHACDVRVPAQVDTVVAAALDRFGHIDVLVNNAGIAWGAPAEHMPIEKWREVLDTNATGTFLMSQTVGRDMVRSGSGSIINIASVAGLVGAPPEMVDAVGYSASKGAVISLTRDLAAKWARHGVRVNAVAPGFFETGLSAGVLAHARTAIEHATALGRIGRPGELNGPVLFLASAAARYVTGHVLSVDGGMTAL